MFRGSLTIVTISGVPVRVHWSFLILLVWVFGSEIASSHSLTSALASVVFVCTIFVCVVAHEFGHIAAARSFGIRTRDVTLLPIGGLATLERMPERPWQELVVALAGPLVNVVIAAVLIPIVLLRGGISSLTTLDAPGRFLETFVASLATINVWLVLFNMLPAIPMDGGRVLRALLAFVLDRTQATRIAAIVGQVFAAGMIAVGLMAGLPFLLLLGVFVLLGARAEGANAEAQRRIRALTAADLMQREFRVLSAHDEIRAAADALLAGRHVDFPVTADGSTTGPIVGAMLHDDVIRGLSTLGAGTPVSALMRSPCLAARPGDSAAQVLATLRGSACPFVPVVDRDHIVGVITRDRISELIALQRAMSGPAPQRA